MAKVGTSEYIHDGAEQAAAQPPNAIPPMPGADWAEERTRVAVAPNVNVSGRLAFKEPVRIEGNFRGDLSSNELVVISDHGSVEGRVRTPRLLVLGVLRGDITDTRLVVLGPRAQVFGRIETDVLRVCEGARLNGDVRVPCPEAAPR
ncbi:MAG TPA: polymer-forming cytoskeletal protein [Candidatus Binataceae bacterium]|nr:polymer-forming cytoskeletal protein [Candidatus Binataceae bacterium]